MGRLSSSASRTPWHPHFVTRNRRTRASAWSRKIEWTKDALGRAAVLTIVRGYIAAGYPNPCTQLASFQDWSLLVRSPLVWLGYADPVETMEAARADDPSRRNLNAFVAAWLRVIGPNKPTTAGEIIAKAYSPADDADRALNTAIAAVATAPGKSELDAMKLGRWLGRNKNRVVNNMKLFGEPDPHTKQQIWWVGPVTCG
jgi:hypothetical protein